MKYLQLIFISFFITIAATGQELPEPMHPKRIVNDFTGMFSPQEQGALEQKLVQFNNNSSTQIAIATVPTLDGYNANDYAQRLAEKWGIGEKGKDNGILILIKPKIGREKGDVAIAVGYGLEGVVPDAIASRIIRNEIIPAFQRGQYYAGINKATSTLIDLTKGEYTASQYAKKGRNIPWEFFIPFAVIFLLPLFVRRRSGYTTGSNTSSVPPFFIGGLGGGRNFGSFSSGSGSFGGFGGGSFGGGGASGSW